MVACRHLNRLFADKLAARSGRFELATAEFENACDTKECESSASDRPSSWKTKLISSDSQQPEAPGEVAAAAMRQTNKENLEPDARLSSSSSSPSRAGKQLIRTVTTLRRRRRETARVRGNKFAILSNELPLPPPPPPPKSLCAPASVAALLLILLTCQICAAHNTFGGGGAANLAGWWERADSGPPVSALDWRRIGANLLRQLQPRPRPSTSAAGSSSSASAAPGRRRPGPLTRALNQVRQQIGARNTIRVHNAFRDFAWRLLSSLSMPTPVIYELRRQNFYSPEEDAANDSLFNRNTSRTIRSKRLLDLMAQRLPLGAPKRHLAKRSSKSDNDDEPETFRDRLRARLEDVLSLSRRSLFGRVVRLPSVFPFKRHEDEEGDDRADAGAATGKPRGGALVTNGRTRPRLLAGLMGGRRRRRQRDSERQIIEINGKQFYVDDDGELKELKGEQSGA